MKTMKCHICNNNYSIISKNIYQCSKCNHRYKKYDDDIIKYHKYQYRKECSRIHNCFDEDRNVLQKFHDDRKQIVTDRSLKIISYLAKEDTCLDIGGGAGTFAQQIKDKVKNIEVLEIEPSLAKESTRLGFQTYQCELEKIQKKYDITFLWHVLEHVENIDQLLSKISSITNKYFIMEIPFGRSIPKKFDGHVHYFSEKSLNKILTKYFEIISTNDGVQKPAKMVICKPKENNK